MSSAPNENEGFINKLRNIIEDNINNEQFGVNELARELGMSRSNLHRKVKSFTGTSVSKFIRTVRLARAKELLMETTSNISEIAFESGFHSVTYFTKCFKEHFGYPPGEARKNMKTEEELQGIDWKITKIGFGKKKTSLVYLISLAAALLLIITIFIMWRPFEGQEEPIEKSIAVLPFINDSPGEDQMYFINGTMDAILNNLCKIKDIRVPGRTTVEQYRNNPKSIPEIAAEMNVSYILEGSGQKIGSNIKLTVQLIDAIHDNHIWAKTYDRNILDMSELFSLQGEVAQLVAEEIKAIVTPEEIELLEQVPTTSIMAYEYWQRGLQEEMNYHLTYEIAALQRAEDLYRYALEQDPEFGWPYVGIAWTYWNRYLQVSNPLTEYYDSVRFLIDRALSCDNRIANAYNLSGYYYSRLGETEKAIRDFNNALDIIPNLSGALDGLGWLKWNENDFAGAIECFHRSVDNRDAGYLYKLKNLSFAYFMAGFKEQSDYYSTLAVEQDGDSATYYHSLARSEYFINKDVRKAVELLERGYTIDSSHMSIIQQLGSTYLLEGQYGASLENFEKYLEELNALGQNDLYNTYLIGLSYWRNGNKEKAEYYFNQQIKYCLDMIDSNIGMHSQLSMVYAFKGENTKAYEHLRILEQAKGAPIFALTYKYDPMYKSIRDDPEFLQIVGNIEDKYYEEHERVSKWLEENEMI